VFSGFEQPKGEIFMSDPDQDNIPRIGDIFLSAFVQAPLTTLEILISDEEVDRGKPGEMPRPAYHLRYRSRLSIAWRLLRRRKRDFENESPIAIKLKTVSKNGAGKI
jgi:hypothetical protein